MAMVFQANSFDQTADQLIKIHFFFGWCPFCNSTYKYWMYFKTNSGNTTYVSRLLVQIQLFQSRIMPISQDLDQPMW